MYTLYTFINGNATLSDKNIIRTNIFHIKYQLLRQCIFTYTYVSHCLAIVVLHQRRRHYLSSK